MSSEGAPAPPGLARGSVVGRYTIIDTVGGGSRSVVYAAFDRTLARRVALKALRGGTLADPSLTERVAREAHLLAKVAHPNVVGIYDIVVAAEAVFLAMELVSGTTLDRWLAAEPRGARAILDAFVQAGRGLAAAHAAGIVHGSFDRASVLVGDDGRARVIGFAVDGRSISGRQEREDAGDDDQRAFSLALSDALGKVPAPAHVRRVLARGLSGDRGARYPSMDALLGDLTADPAARWRRGLLVAGGVGTIASALLFGRHLNEAESRVCHGSEKKLAGIWDDERKASLERVFAATGRPFAADAWRGTRAAIDAYARDWVAARTDACEATRTRRTQSEQMLDLRMACLDDRLKEVNALVDVLAHADEQVVTNAFAASQALARVAYCDDAKALTARVRAPTDAVTAAKVAALRERLARVKAMDDAGKYKDATPLVVQIETEAEATSDPAVRAAALYALGHVQTRNGDLSLAERSLRRAVVLADTAADDRTRTRALGGLLYLVGKEEAKYDEIPLLREEALGAMDRLGSDDAILADLQQDLGAAALSQGKYDDARDAYQKGVDLAAKLYGEGSWQVGTGLSNLAVAYQGLGDDDHAIDVEKRALAIVEKTLGPDHPRTAAVEGVGIGIALAEEGKLTEAEPYLRRAVRIGEASWGMESPLLAGFLDNLGLCLSDQGKYEEALECHQRALAIREKTQRPDYPLLVDSLEGIADSYIGLNRPELAVPYLERALGLPRTGRDTDLAEVEFTLAVALDRVGKSPARARTLAADAQSIFESSGAGPADAKRLVEIKAWLAKRPSR